MNTKKMALAIITLIAITALSILPFAFAADWETVTTITGSEDQTSSTFSITAQEWRLQWSYTPDPDFPSLTFFGVLVYPEGEGATFVDSFYVNGSTQTSGTEYIHEGMNSYHLEILDANIPSYNIIVQQYGETSSSNSNGNTTIIIFVAIAITVLIVIVAALLLWKRKSQKPAQQPPPPPLIPMTAFTEASGDRSFKNKQQYLKHVINLTV
jgi:flagellar basal body-associated protein FliL